MYRALFEKELRESLPLVALALAAYVYSLLGLTGTVLPGYESARFSVPVPFASFDFGFPFVTISLAFLLSLAARQTHWDLGRNTSQLLLQLPIERGQVLAVKLGFGLGIYLVMSGLTLLIYAVWAWLPGHHASPFRWGMTSTAWQAWLSLTAVYLAAFLSGLRPARWFGTRLLPLVGGATLVFLMQFLPWWWPYGALGIVLLDVLLAQAILVTAEVRDYA